MNNKIKNIVGKYKTASFLEKENIVIINNEFEKAGQRIDDFYGLIDELKKVCEINVCTYVNNENLQEYLAIRIIG